MENLPPSPDLSHLGISKESVETLRVLSEVPNLEIAGKLLAGRGVVVMKGDGPWPGLSQEASKVVAQRVHTAFKELGQGISRLENNKLNPQQEEFVKHVGKQLNPSSSSVLLKAADTASHILDSGGSKNQTNNNNSNSPSLGKYVPAGSAGKEFLKEVSKRKSGSPTIEVGSKKGLSKGRNTIAIGPQNKEPQLGNTLGIKTVSAAIQIKRQIGDYTNTLSSELEKADLGDIAPHIQVSLALSEDSRTPLSVRALLTPVTGEGTASGHCFVMKTNVAGGSVDDIKAQIKQSPDLQSERVAIVKPSRQALGGENAIFNDPEANYKLADYGQVPGLDTLHEALAYQFTVQSGLPCKVPPTASALLFHHTLGAPAEHVKSLHKDFNVMVNESTLLKEMSSLEGEGRLNPIEFGSKLEELALEHVAGEIKQLLSSSGLELQMPEHELIPLLQTALATGTPEGFAATLAMHTEGFGDVAAGTKRILFGGTQVFSGDNGDFEMSIPPANQGLNNLLRDLMPTTKQQAQADGGSTRFQELGNELFNSLKRPLPAMTPQLCSVQKFVPGGTLFNALSPEEKDRVTPTAWARVALLDGRLMNKDRFGSNILTVEVTQGELQERLNQTLPAFGDFITGSVNVPANIETMSPYDQQNFISNEADRLIGQWNSDHPEQQIDSSRLDAEFDVYNMVTMSVRGESSCRDIVCIDNAMGFPDPTVGNGAYLTSHANNQWMLEQGARVGGIPTLTRQTIASQDPTAQIIALREEQQRIQQSAGPENRDLTHMSEDTFKMLLLAGQIQKRAAGRNCSLVEMAIIKDSPSLNLANGQFASLPKFLDDLWKRFGDGKSFDDMNSPDNLNQLNEAIDQHFDNIAITTGGREQQFEKITLERGVDGFA